jgi:hypothetical protein
MMTTLRTMHPTEPRAAKRAKRGGHEREAKTQVVACGRLGMVVWRSPEHASSARGTHCGVEQHGEATNVLAPAGLCLWWSAVGSCGDPGSRSVRPRIGCPSAAPVSGWLWCPMIALGLLAWGTSTIYTYRLARS